jgi:hypothetical protein
MSGTPDIVDHADTEIDDRPGDAGILWCVQNDEDLLVD